MVIGHYQKTTEAVVQSLASVTHSYMIQVLISMSGKLGRKLYICFQEAGGQFGKFVTEEERKIYHQTLSLNARGVANCPLHLWFLGWKEFWKKNYRTLRSFCLIPVQVKQIQHLHLKSFPQWYRSTHKSYST